ncbi:MAG: hypothetical protein OXF08_06275 [Bacteroidetes bacterium]|nr:hypothetical protein [Bacteroidota bacterium]
MNQNNYTRLVNIQDFEQLIAYLHDEMDWPVRPENIEDIFFEYSSEDLGLDSKNAAKIQSIKRMRPLHVNQPWGIIFVEFDPKRLPIIALRRILNHFLEKQNRTIGTDDRKWKMEDLLFISNYGISGQRHITFAHFTAQNKRASKLKVIDWDERNTQLHLKHVHQQLTQYLAWPSDSDHDTWRKQWRKAFTTNYEHAIRTSKELSERLAELARRIRERIISALEIETESGDITRLMKSFQETLVHNLDNQQFADMVAQTITYGLLSARITSREDSSALELTNSLRTNPLLHELMMLFMNLDETGHELDFDELGVSEVQDFLSNTDMEPVIRDFGDKNPREDPVIHFYENFLAQYDKEQKVKRGVFYTPLPVVKYIVESIDVLLRKKFGLEDGLADTSSWGDVSLRNKDVIIPDGVTPETHFVQILDPATGTGTFLVEVIDRIHKTLQEKYKKSKFFRGGGIYFCMEQLCIETLATKVIWV